MNQSKPEKCGDAQRTFDAEIHSDVFAFLIYFEPASTWTA